MRSFAGSRWMRRAGILAVAGWAAAGLPRSAQGQAPVALGGEERRAVVEELANDLASTYVFPEEGEKYAASIRGHLERGDYDRLEDAAEFANRLTNDLHAVRLDKHLRVLAPNDPGGARFRAPAPAPGDAPRDPRQAFAERSRATNFGFAKVEILPGNVGRIELREFVPAEVAGPTATAAMGFVANCDALIFDIRRNGGGSPSMIQLLSSYLFDGPQLLNTFYVREGDQTQQFSTLPHVPGERRPDLDVFVLTSATTFSAAEEFAYNLKSMERATIVGETTGGGAHPVRPADLGHGFIATIPFGRAINPITGTNWEGTGVAPDLACPAADALDVAHAEALERIAKRTPDGPAKRAIEWTLEETRAKSRTPRGAAQWKDLVGKYGVRSVTLEADRVAIQRDHGPKFGLNPVAEDLFAMDGTPAPTRVRFVRGANGRVTEIVLSTPEGEIERAKRS